MSDPDCLRTEMILGSRIGCCLLETRHSEKFSPVCIALVIAGANAYLWPKFLVSPSVAGVAVFGRVQCVPHHSGPIVAVAFAVTRPFRQRHACAATGISRA